MAAFEAPPLPIAPTGNSVALPSLKRLPSLAALPIVGDLAEVERILHETLRPERPSILPLVEHLGHYRGKRLRPLLLLLTAHACGKVTHAHHVLGAVVEMIHTATLVHDDVLDEADLRRHVRTVNARWGNKRSILLGDWLFTHAFHLTSTLGDAETCRLIGSATNRVCGGEMLQTMETGNLDLTEEAYLAIIDGKTAALTEVCGRLGARHAGAGPETVEKLAVYGRCLGLAFQVADDLLDLEGNEEVVGKTLGTDLAQRKLTLPLLVMFDRLPTKEAADLRELLRAAAPNSLERVRAALDATDALAYSRERAQELAMKARLAVQVLPPSPSRAYLEQLTEWSVCRNQ